MTIKDIAIIIMAAVLVQQCTAKADIKDDPNMSQFVTPKGQSKASKPLNVAYPFILLHPSEKNAQLIKEWKK